MLKEKPISVRYRKSEKSTDTTARTSKTFTEEKSVLVESLF